jgi:hypothetical protein
LVKTGLNKEKLGTLNLAPIVLFVYNRPWHTLQTLKALAENEFAQEFILFIYADGPKYNCGDEMLVKVK